MVPKVYNSLFIFLFLSLAFFEPLYAQRSKLITFKMSIKEDNVTMYSGPSFRFRPIRTLDKGAVLRASPNQKDGPDGSFYEVYYTFKKSKRKVIGYISTGAAVEMEGGDTQEDLTQYVKLELAETAIWASFSALSKENYLWAFSYVKYPGPGLYLKFLGGQFINLSSSNTVVGAELGLDQIVYKKISIYSSFAWTMLFAAQEEALFEASQGVTPFVYATFGARYNIDRYAALSAGLLFASLFNQNNASLISGLGFGLEVGL
jgi:hypothetical protein